MSGGEYGSFVDSVKEEEEEIVPYKTFDSRRQYETIHEFRIRNDFILWTMEKDNTEFRDYYLIPMIGTIMETYKEKDEHGVGVQGGLKKSEHQILLMICNEGNDDIKQSLWFSCIVLVPALYHWLTHPTIQNGMPFPKINNLEWFEIFAKNNLTNHIETVLNGNMKVVAFINAVRYDYVKNIGFADPTE
jgi:hypothetical protein